MEPLKKSTFHIMDMCLADTSHPLYFIAPPSLVPGVWICAVSLHNSHYGGVRFGAAASECLSCLSGSVPSQL